MIKFSDSMFLPSCYWGNKLGLQLCIYIAFLLPVCNEFWLNAHPFFYINVRWLITSNVHWLGDWIVVC